jgi:hypothetical protein
MLIGYMLFVVFNYDYCPQSKLYQFLPFEIFKKVLTDLQFASDLQPLFSITNKYN